MDTRRIETLLTLQTMLLALGVGVYAESARYYGNFELLAFLLPVAVLVGGFLSLALRGFEYLVALLTSEFEGVQSE